MVAGGVGEKGGDREDEGNGEAEQRKRHGRRTRGRTKQTQQSTRRGTLNNTHICTEGGLGVVRGVGEEGGGEQGERGERRRRRRREGEERHTLPRLLSPEDEVEKP